MSSVGSWSRPPEHFSTVHSASTGGGEDRGSAVTETRNSDNNNNNERISRAPFHVKHAQLR